MCFNYKFAFDFDKCEQIGLFLNDLVNKFYFQISQNLGAILKNTTSYQRRLRLLC